MNEQTSGKSPKTTATVKMKPVATTVEPEQVLTTQVNSSDKPLKECVLLAMKNYYTRVDGGNPSEIYEMVLTQVEPPLLEVTLEFTGGNQSKAAMLLGISRGTLRKKLKKYGFD